MHRNNFHYIMENHERRFAVKFKEIDMLHCDSKQHVSNRLWSEYHFPFIYRVTQKYSVTELATIDNCLKCVLKYCMLFYFNYFSVYFVIFIYSVVCIQGCTQEDAHIVENSWLWTTIVENRFLLCFNFLMLI